jgi:hypothetical protein
MYAWSAENEDLSAALHRIGGLSPPDGGLGGWAAARLLGATDLDGETTTGHRMPILLCMPRRQTCRRVESDVRVWRSDLGSEDLVRVDGTPVTSPVRTGFDLARLSARDGRAGRGPGEGAESLVLLEALLRTRTTTIDEIAAYAAEHPRKAGARQSRWVIEHAEAGTRSCQETRFRQLWTLDAGLPQPLVNARVTDRDGSFLAEVDLLDPQAGLAGEYDGAHHAAADQRAADHARAEHLEELGLMVVRVASPDLSQFRARTVQRLQRAHQQGLARDRRRDGWYLQTHSA